MEYLDSLLYQHEVVMDTSTPSEGTLVGCHQFVHIEEPNGLPSSWSQALQSCEPNLWDDNPWLQELLISWGLVLYMQS